MERRRGKREKKVFVCFSFGYWEDCGFDRLITIGTVPGEMSIGFLCGRQTQSSIKLDGKLDCFKRFYTNVWNMWDAFVFSNLSFDTIKLIQYNQLVNLLVNSLHICNLIVV